MNETNAHVSRRHVLRTASVVLGGCVAGCTGLLGSEEGTPSDAGTEEPTATAVPSATPTSTPTATPDRPGIERQVIQRDRAAITHVRRTVSGEITWPETQVYNRVDQSLLGTWESTDYTVEFTDEAEFAERGPDVDRQGTYAAYGGFLYLTYDSGTEATLEYEIGREDGQDVVDFWTESGEQIGPYTRTAAGSDDRGVVEVFADQVVVEAENGTTRREGLQGGGAGSGFIATPQGHVVTNAHVVGADEDPSETLYYRLAVTTRQAIRRQISDEFDLTESERQQVEEIVADTLFSYYAEHSQVRDVSTAIDVLLGRAPPDEDLEVDSFPARIETAGTVREQVGGEPSWGRDVAVLKVDGQDPLPTVPLGDATNLGTGEDIFVVGYPDLGIQQLFEDRSTTLEPTLTTGVVSARRTLNSGVETVQTDAGINNGNSGGPMYNADGEVVGIATFKPADLDLDEIAFGLPIEIAEGFLGELGVENRPGELTTAYREGLNAYWRGDCEAVREHMSTVTDLWPDHPYAQGFVEDC